MSHLSIVEPTAADQQISLYNQSSTTLIQRSTYSPGANTAWAIVACPLAGAVIEGDIPTLVTSLEALSEISNVANPQFYGHTPVSLLAGVSYSFWLSTESSLNANIGYGGDLRKYVESQYERVVVPEDQKFLVINAVVPAALNETSIVALETAITGITGISNAEVLLEGVIPDNASGINITITTRLRIDASS